ncbi:MAG: hypothetical protein HY815_00060 [Candidatus Riflebacteria bacterium]|nr:hypothetical protein [Candidatus Riflebacteria bacterium]
MKPLVIALIWVFVSSASQATAPSAVAPPAASATTSAAPAASIAPGNVVTFEAHKAKLELAPPAGWVEEDEGRSYADKSGQKGGFTIEVLPMELPDKTLHILNESALDQGRDKVKKGGLASCEMKVVNGIEGVLIVEIPKDPATRRMEWKAHFKQYYICLTFSAPAAAFARYQPVFESVLGSVKLLEPK